MAQKMNTFERRMVNTDGDLRERVIYQRHMADDILLQAMRIVSSGTVGEAVAAGDVLYMNTDGKYMLADATSADTMPGVVMALSSMAADSTGTLLHFGYLEDESWSWTVGRLIYISKDATTGNTLTQTGPNVTGDQVQVAGYARTATEMLFNPSYVLVQVP